MYKINFFLRKRERTPIDGDGLQYQRNKNLMKELNPGDTIMVCNGLVSFRVDEIVKNDAICTVIHGGEMSDRKSMNFPNKVMHHEFLSEQDKEDLLFGIQNGVDFVAEPDLDTIFATNEEAFVKAVELIEKIS